MTFCAFNCNLKWTHTTIHWKIVIQNNECHLVLYSIVTNSFWYNMISSGFSIAFEIPFGNRKTVNGNMVRCQAINGIYVHVNYLTCDRLIQWQLNADFEMKMKKKKKAAEERKRRKNEICTMEMEPRHDAWWFIRYNSFCTGQPHADCPNTFTKYI